MPARLSSLILGVALALPPLVAAQSHLATFEAIDISTTADWKYQGGVMAGNGRVYFVPLSVNNIGVFDPSTRAFSKIDISKTISRKNKYSGGVLAGNGRIYFVPRDANNIGELDPSTGAFSTIDISTKISHIWKYRGGVLAGNGRVYFVELGVRVACRGPAARSRGDRRSKVEVAPKERERERRA